MYRHKTYREREVEEVLRELQPIVEAIQAESIPPVRRIFVADGDALAMPMTNWRQLLEGLHQRFPRLNRISCYATARNLLEKSVTDLKELRQLGLNLLYIGPESGDDKTLKSIAKGATFAEHAEAAKRAHAAEMKQSLIFLLGAAGLERSLEHARGAGRLTTAMDPRYVSLLTVTVVPDTPLATLHQKGRFKVPDVKGLLEEIRAFLIEAQPKKSIFRSNHASNYLPLSGQIPRDTPLLLETLDAALHDEIPLRPEWMRGL